MPASGTGVVKQSVRCRLEAKFTENTLSTFFAGVEKKKGQWPVAVRARKKCQSLRSQLRAATGTKGNKSATPSTNVNSDTPASFGELQKKFKKTEK